MDAKDAILNMAALVDHMLKEMSALSIVQDREGKLSDYDRGRYHALKQIVDIIDEGE